MWRASHALLVLPLFLALVLPDFLFLFVLMCSVQVPGEAPGARV